MQSYFDIYLNQLFITLGQLTGVLVSSTIVVPVYTYYSRGFIRNELRELFKD